MTRLGVIAGGGDLPRRLAEHARGSGREVFILSLRGFADPKLTAEFGGAEAAMGEPTAKIAIASAVIAPHVRRRSRALEESWSMETSP